MDGKGYERVRKSEENVMSRDGRTVFLQLGRKRTSLCRRLDR
jgi:hypothetical protein